MMKKMTRKLLLPLAAALSLGGMAENLNADIGDCCMIECCQPDDCCWSITLGADFILWDAYQRNNDFAAKADNDFPVVEGHFRSFDYDWRPGFRVGLGIDDLFCGCDFYFGYTWIRHRDSISIHADDDEVVVSNLPVDGGFYSEASGKRSVRTQLWDILFSHQFELCDCNYMTPYFGIQIAKIDQHLDGEFEQFDGEFGAPNEDIKWGGTFTGAGLKAGLAWEYRYDDCMSLFAKSSIALLAGNSKWHYDRTAFNLGELLGEDDFSGRQGNFVPSSHLAVGVKYIWMMCDTPVYLKASWDFLHFYNLPKYPRHLGGGKNDAFDSNNLGYQGLTLGASLNF